MKYIITNEFDGELFWSNDDGWVDRENATLFSKNEKFVLNLPMQGMWVEA
jgi:hypothetical protein